MRLLIICLLMAFVSSECIAKELYRFNNEKTIYEIVSEIENQTYGHSYDEEVLNVRIERLESTLFKVKSKGALQARVDRIKYSLARTKSQNSNIKEQVFLELIENRYLGKSYKQDGFEDRLTRLENAILGMPLLGTPQYRFDNLVKRVPLNIVGITVTDSSGGKATIKPEIKTPEEYSPLASLSYAGYRYDYFDNISKSKDNKVLRWRDFPIFVYIDEYYDKNNVETAKKAIETWAKVIQLYITGSPKNANIIVTWISDRDSSGPIFISGNDGHSQIIINGSYYKRTTELNRFLLHEIGHSIGIWGHSNDPKDIMYNFREIGQDILSKNYTNAKNTSINSAPDEPSRRDVNTLIMIYGSSSSADD